MIESVGFTGTQRGMTRAQYGKVAGWLEGLRVGGASEFHHGDCVGADSEAHGIAYALGFTIVGHPCDIEAARAFNSCDRTEPVDRPLVRNRLIVSASHVLVGAPSGAAEVRRSGTWATIRYARAAGLLRLVVRPDGSTVVGEESSHEG